MEIVTVLEVLHKISLPVASLEIKEIATQLVDSLPEKALGLSAPQIGIHKRMFIANLSMGSYIFVNPEITWTSPDKVFSQEGCLSLPGVLWCVDRHKQIKIKWEELLEINDDPVLLDQNIRLKDLDAFIVQHEIDHLNGIVLTDKTQVPTEQERTRNRILERNKKIHESRKKTASVTSSPSKHFSLKKLTKIKKQEKNRNRTLKKREKIRVETEERFRAEQEGLFGS